MTAIKQNESQEIDLITVIMDEANITSTVVNDNRINIPNVTSDIVIIGKGTTISLMGIDDMTVNKGESFNISYCSNVPAIKHEISLDGGKTFTNKTAEIKISNLVSYKCFFEAISNYNSMNVVVRVTDAKGNMDTKSFTITFVDANINALNYMTYGKSVNQTTAEIKDNAGYWATIDPIVVVKGQVYTVKMNATHAWVYSFDDNDRFKTSLVGGSGSNPQEYTFTADSNKIRLGCYDSNKQLTYCTLTKKSREKQLNKLEKKAVYTVKEIFSNNFNLNINKQWLTPPSYVQKEIFSNNFNLNINKTVNRPPISTIEKEVVSNVFHLNVNKETNKPPTITNLKHLLSGKNCTITFSIHDEDNDKMNVYLTRNGLEELVLSNQSSGDKTITINNLSTGNHIISLRVNDGKLNAYSDTFRVTIEEDIVNNPPTVSNIQVKKTNSVGVYELEFEIQDSDNDKMDVYLKVGDSNYEPILINQSNGVKQYKGQGLSVGNHTCFIKVSDGKQEVISNSFIVRIPQASSDSIFESIELITPTTIKANTPTRVAIRLKSKSNIDKRIIHPKIKGIENRVKIRNAQFEKGNVLTDWRKSVSEISDKTSNLKVGLEEITSTVENIQGDYVTSSRIEQLDNSWTAKFKDGYHEGITSINKDGITVTSNSVRSKTSMSADGFKIIKTDTGENVFEVNQDGTLGIKGAIKSGSTITGATISGGSMTIGNVSQGNYFKINSDGSFQAGSVDQWNYKATITYGNSGFYIRAWDDANSKARTLQFNGDGFTMGNTNYGDRWISTGGGTLTFNGSISQEGGNFKTTGYAKANNFYLTNNSTSALRGYDANGNSVQLVHVGADNISKFGYGSHQTNTTGTYLMGGKYVAVMANNNQPTGTNTAGGTVYLCCNGAIPSDGGLRVLEFTKDSNDNYLFRHRSANTSKGVYLGSASYRWYKVYTNASADVSSDRTLKENIEYIDGTVSNYSAKTNKDINSMDMYNFVKDDLALAKFNYIGHKETEIGFIAQDLIYNADGTENKVGNYIVDAKSAREENRTLSYNTGNYTNVLAGALKQAIQKIEKLEREVEELKCK